MKTLFISKRVESSGALATYCKSHGILLIAESLIQFELVKANDIPYADVIFFTSPRSVTYFLQQAEIQKNQQLAVVGSQTKELLIQLGYDVHFTGATPTQPDLIAQKFGEWLNGRSVLFPQSSRSNRTMQRYLAENQYENRVVYNTLIVEKHIQPQPDIVIFSSPSNVEAYLSANTLNPKQLVLAFGTTTADYLANKGISSTLLSGVTEQEIVQSLERMPFN